jgi:hypothetical protein
MSKRLYSAAVALLVVGGLAAVAHAKPPDLPVSFEDFFGSAQPVAQEQQVAQQVPNNYYEVPPPDPDLPLPLGWQKYESSSPLFTEADAWKQVEQQDNLHATSDSEDPCPCLCEAFQQLWHSVSAYMGANAANDSDDSEAADADSKPVDDAQPETAAPAKHARKHRKPRSKPQTLSLGDTTEDVQKMLAARRMYQIGQRCARTGDLDMARNCFQETHLLAPTSRYGRHAIDRLSEIELRQATDETSDAEQQEQPSERATQANQRRSARQMYRIGQRCQRAGDHDMAINCFTEAKLLCPNGTYGRLAAQRLDEIEAQHAADEQAEPCEEPAAAPPGDEDEASSADKPSDARLAEGVEEGLEGATAPVKPALELVEKPESAAPAIDSAEEQEDEATDTDRPLYVDPPARKLTIKEEPQNPEE